ncbi:protein translocase SEC61 complex subunit gamma [Candidatus Micrarchaeota archaeon]|nr:protein translocase SEC61 complex subunit gamma [Candidatus Micrarchaeota archaeon]
MEIVELIRRCIRILHIARKPTTAEYEKVAKVAAAGMAVFGIIGLVISLVFGLFE